MKLSEIIEILEKEFPKELAFSWDNVGLSLGKGDNEIKKVLLTLDVTPDVCNEAISAGAELILSHHPMIFEGIKSLSEDTPQNKMIADLIRHNISVYSAHTNLDNAPCGINQKLAEMMGLSNLIPLDDESGLGRVGDTEDTVLGEFAKSVVKTLNTPVKVTGDSEKPIKRVAIGSGSCGEFWQTALKKGADVFVTADIKYHVALDAAASGLALIDAGHFPTEIIVTDIFENILKNTELILIKTKSKDIFSYNF